MRKLSQRVHRSFLLREAEHFRDHKKGIPEWLKNADDSYTRHEEFNQRDFSDLPILLNFTKNEFTGNEIICLDFGGASAEIMVEHIPHYGSPDAATHGKKLTNRQVSGGHGSGGKFYALSQFRECRVISYYDGKLTILELSKEDDYIVDEDRRVSPEEAIKIVGFQNWSYFKNQGKDILRKILNKQLNFFCWKGSEPKDLKQIAGKRNLVNVLASIANHPQSRSALRSRIVHALLNGELIFPCMKPQTVEEDPTFGVREFSLPNDLGGTKFNKYFNSTLKVTLSKVPLIGERSSLNILEIDAFEKNIAYYEMPVLLLDKGLSKNLYAQIDCPELKEYRCVSNDRFHLIDGEISHLFLDWCKIKLKEVLDELTNKEKKTQEKRQLDELGNFLKELTDEISDLLEEENILKSKFKQDGAGQSKVDVPSKKPGFGGEGKIGTKGGGIRTGGIESKEGPSELKKQKSKIQILVSNHDPDPLNPGKTYDMIERQPILFQRVEDVDYGIWWINSQKNYIKKIKIRDPGAAPFYFFLVKETVFSHRARRRFRERESYDPDGLEELNFQLIDDIFSKVVGRLGIDLSADKTDADRLRELIKQKGKFTISELSEESGIDPIRIHVFINEPSNGVLANFKVVKQKAKGFPINVYIKK